MKDDLSYESLILCLP